MRSECESSEAQDVRMRQGIVLAAATPSLSEILFLKPLPFSRASAVPFRRLSASPLPPLSPPKPSVPLFLRPPKHAGTLSDLRQWHAWAKRLATSVGSSFVLSDGGPNSTHLCRELGWLLEDVLDSSDINPRLVDRASTDEDGQSKVNLRAEIEDLYRLWKQRIEGRLPFQYIVGCEHWRDLVLWVREGVLIPRPETEAIIDLVVDAVGRNHVLRDGLWADLGTGSGAIAIGVSRVLGNVGKVFATDLSEVVLEVASYNVCRYGLQDVIELRKGSWFEPLKDVEGKLAGVVSNPPYIPSDDILGLQAEVGRHEPRLALDGGVDGTDDLVQLCHGAASFLIPGGFFAFETNGEKQCQFIVEYLGRELKGRFRNVDRVNDFSGIPRFVIGFRC